jgi:tRNA (guanine37-N1)-methyltransferase
MTTHRNVKTVLLQTGAVKGQFRLRKLEHIAGEENTITTHKESNCRFNVDLATCYFSPRLANERKRIAQKVKNDEVIVNMFAGVGCFSIVIAKQRNVQKIYSIDINPEAIKYMKKNVRINGVFGKVIPIRGDAKEIIKKKLCHTADRVLMPLPEKAIEYFPFAILALKQTGGSIHCYDFEHANKTEDATKKAEHKFTQLVQILDTSTQLASSKIIRTIGPNWYQVVVDFKKTPKEIPDQKV